MHAAQEGGTRGPAHLLVGEAVEGPGEAVQAGGHGEVGVGERGADEVHRVRRDVAALVICTTATAVTAGEGPNGPNATCADPAPAPPPLGGPAHSWC